MMRTGSFFRQKPSKFFPRAPRMAAPTEPVLLGLPRQVVVAGLVQLEGKEQAIVHDVQHRQRRGTCHR
jgi:hypothetical protein